MWKRPPINIRSYTFRANPPLHRETPCSTYTFPHVLCDPPAESCKRPTGSSPNGGQSGCGSNVNGCPSRGHSERGFHRNGISLPSCVLFAIWGVCPQMAISDTCRHVPDTFLHVPCPCLQFRNLSPLPASLYPPFLGAHARALQSCKGKAPHSLSCMPFGAFVLKWQFLIRADTCRTRSYTYRATLPLNP